MSSFSILRPIICLPFAFPFGGDGFSVGTVAIQLIYSYILHPVFYAGLHQKEPASDLLRSSSLPVSFGSHYLFRLIPFLRRRNSNEEPLPFEFQQLYFQLKWKSNQKYVRFFLSLTIDLCLCAAFKFTLIKIIIAIEMKRVHDDVQCSRCFACSVCLLTPLLLFAGDLCKKSLNKFHEWSWNASWRGRSIRHKIFTFNYAINRFNDYKVQIQIE